MRLGTIRRVYVVAPSYGDPLGQGHFEDRGTAIMTAVNWRWWVFGLLFAPAAVYLWLGPLRVEFFHHV